MCEMLSSTAGRTTFAGNKIKHDWFSPALNIFPYSAAHSTLICRGIRCTHFVQRKAALVNQGYCGESYRVSPRFILSLQHHLVPDPACLQDSKDLFLNVVPVSLKTQITLIKEKDDGSFSLDYISFSATEHLLYFPPNKNEFYMIQFAALRGKSVA